MLKQKSCTSNSFKLVIVSVAFTPFSRSAVQLGNARRIDIRTGHGVGSGRFVETPGRSQRGHGYAVAPQSHPNLGEALQVVLLLADQGRTFARSVFASGR